jgi:hypothetical protein
MAAPWFIAIKIFGPANGDDWIKYVEWSGLSQLEELISLDTMLCPTILPDIKADYWPHIVQEDGCLHFFTDLAFLLQQVADSDGSRILCIYRNSESLPVLPAELSGFRPVGYDLVDDQTSISALSNCGGWPGVLDNSELSRAKDSLRSTHGPCNCRSCSRGDIPKSIMPIAMFGRSLCEGVSAAWDGGRCRRILEQATEFDGFELSLSTGRGD